MILNDRHIWEIKGGVDKAPQLYWRQYSWEKENSDIKLAYSCGTRQSSLTVGVGLSNDGSTIKTVSSIVKQVGRLVHKKILQLVHEGES